MSESKEYKVVYIKPDGEEDSCVVTSTSKSSAEAEVSIKKGVKVIYSHKTIESNKQ